MPRFVLFAIRLAYVLAIFLGPLTEANAQDAWPTYAITNHELPRGTGGYFSWLSLLLIVLIYLLWVKTTDWVNKDTQQLRLNHYVWNAVTAFPFLAVMLLVVLNLPFSVGYTLLVLSWLVPLSVFIYVRNANVEPHQKVLTPAHIRHLIAHAGKGAGVDIRSERQQAHEKGAQVTFKPQGKDNDKIQANLILARQAEGYVAAKDLIADAFERRAEKIMVDVETESVVTRYQIDGVWHEADAMDVDHGRAVLDVFKLLIDGKVLGVGKRQAGRLNVKYNEHASEIDFVSQGMKTGERVMMHMMANRIPFKSIQEAGMREKMVEQVSKILASPSGIFLFSSMPGGGLSTTMALTEKLCDRYLRDFTSFQDQNSPEPLAENIDLSTFDGTKDSVKEKLTTLFRKDPDVVIVHDISDKEIIQLVCDRAASDKKLILSSIRAKEAAEALLRVLMTKVSANSFAPAILAVLNQRLIRRLCEDCKEEFSPSPDMLKKLGIPVGRVDILYRPPEDPDEKAVCKKCGGLGYFGRTSIFELLVVDDKIRQALMSEPKLEVLRKLAREGGNRTLQEEGILLVAQGITSIPELTRVLKQ